MGYSELRVVALPAVVLRAPMAVEEAPQVDALQSALQAALQDAIRTSLQSAEALCSALRAAEALQAAEALRAAAKAALLMVVLQVEALWAPAVEALQAAEALQTVELQVAEAL